MKHLGFITLILVFIQLQCLSQPYSINDGVKRIIFLGNSITYMGDYVTDIEYYMTIQHPERCLEFINVGLPSETVSGLSEPNHAGGKFPRPDLRERLERVLTKTKPDLVFSCYGMNDGIYLSYDDDRFDKYREGIHWLNDEVIKYGAEIIHITPPIYDERKGKAYSNVLDLYSDWLISKRYTSDWKVIDIHWPMKKHLEDQRIMDSTFVFAKDGIHPNKTGQFFIAKHILLQLGEEEILEIPGIDNLLSIHPFGDSIYTLIDERQGTMKDAWLTSTGHTRPGMKTGLPLDEASQKSNEIEKRIQYFLQH